MDILWSLLGFIVVMGLIVTIHEWGHYQVARWFDIKVVKFSLGFGKTLYTRQRGETEFVISQIPLGGYVKFADEREASVAPEDVSRAFNRQSVYKRFAVVIAGPLVNLLLAWLVFAMMYMVGVSGMKPIISEVTVDSPLHQSTQALNASFSADLAWSVSEINGVDVYSWQMVHQQILQALAVGDDSLSVAFTSVLNQQAIMVNDVSLSAVDINQPKQNWLALLGFVPTKPFVPAVVGEVVQAGPAQQAGLMKGDKVIAIDEKPIHSWQDFVKVVQANPGQVVKVEFTRSQANYDADVLLDSKILESGQSVGRMGVGVQVDEEMLKPYFMTVQYGFVDALQQAYIRSVDLMKMSLVMLKRMIIGEVSTANLSGPISIAQFSGQAIQSGLVAFLSLVGLLSLSIGILNLLPIPVLDGGHLMYYLIEMIKGSPVSEKIMVAGQYVGLMLIISLTFLALFNDVIRISNG